MTDQLNWTDMSKWTIEAQAINVDFQIQVELSTHKTDTERCGVTETNIKHTKNCKTKKVKENFS